MTRRPLWMTLLLVLLVAYSLAHVGYSIAQYNPISYPYVSGDFGRAFGEMLHWRAGDALAPREILHPPLYYVLLRPLAPLPFTTVAKLLYFSQFILYALAIRWMVLAASGASRPRAVDYLLAAVLTVNFQPFLETVALHKVEGIEFVLICLAIFSFRKRRDALTGALVVLAANLKYLPGILGLYFLVKRERRVMVGMLVASVVVLAVSVVAMAGPMGGWVAVLRYPLALLADHQHEGNRPEASIEFQTLSGTVNRWLVGPEGMVRHFETQAYAAVSQPGLALAIAAVLKLGLVGLYLYAMRRRWTARARETHWPVVLCEISLTLTLIFIIAQASRVHYAVLLLPAFVSAALLLMRYPDVLGWSERILFAAAYGLTAMLIPGGLLNRLPPHHLWGAHPSFAYLWFSLPFSGYLLLGVCLLRCRSRLLRAGVVAGEQAGG
ncbi:MAG: DUF2029 domain-containing protein [Candidatus Omnitrophica bacterium]|nr:DUF2029 domain-containing protein [Candidatus Omnitrophota bacterium]